MFKHIPDWFIYGSIVLLIYMNATRTATEQHAPQPPPPPELGQMLPKESPRDVSVLVELDDPTSGIGTAFAIDEDGSWLTARHVVDGCDRVALNLGQRRAVRMTSTVSKITDIAVLSSNWTRDPLPSDLFSQRQIGEYGYFFGFPQGKPGEAVGSLIGRHKMIVRGRYKTQEPILAWTEIGRTHGINGSLGGMSGGPVFNKDGAVIGVVAAESPRRGRIYTVAPKNLAHFFPKESNRTGRPIDPGTYGREADKYRRDRRIAQVICLVN